MRRVNLKIYAEVMECSEDMTISTHLMGVSTDDPNQFPYKPGMISLKYHCIAEIFYIDKMLRSVMNQNPQTYYFGSFTSIDELVAQNEDGKYTDLLIEISSHEGVTGIVTNPEGFKSMVQGNDMVIEPKIEKGKVKSKK